jgi:hypothetical protein
MLRDEPGKSCDLGFAEQCRIVADAIKSGFKHDGCSFVPDWGFGETCCGEHDSHYWQQTVSRREADRRMRDCILKVASQEKERGNRIIEFGFRGIAWTYWSGVRIGGWFFWNRRRKQNESTDIGSVLRDADAHERLRDGGGDGVGPA